MTTTKGISFERADGTEVSLPTRALAHLQPLRRQRNQLGLSRRAFTRDDLDEEGPEFCEDYFSGRYDRACDECGGAGKIQEVDRALANKRDLKAYDAQEESLAEMHAIERQERLMEGGWREEGWR